jgi:hypothetical protein
MITLQRIALALAAMFCVSHAASSRADIDPREATSSTPRSLRHASTQEWLEADTQSQLATASEWVLSSKQLKLKTDMSAVQRHADKLRQCINGALHGHSKLYAGMRVADVATTCLITMKL